MVTVTCISILSMVWLKQRDIYIVVFFCSLHVALAGFWFRVSGRPPVPVLPCAGLGFPSKDNQPLPCSHCGAQSVKEGVQPKRESINNMVASIEGVRQPKNRALFAARYPNHENRTLVWGPLVFIFSLPELLDLTLAWDAM